MGGFSTAGFFTQKGNPPAYKRRTLLLLILEGNPPSPHGYLGGNPPHGRKPRGQNVPQPRGNPPSRIYLESTPDTDLEDTPHARMSMAKNMG